MNTETKERSRSGVSGLVFVGCLLVAFALGLLMGNMAAYVLGGLGVGFVAMAVTRLITGEW